MAISKSTATHPHHAYPLLIIAWGILAFGVAEVLRIGTLLANSVVAVAVLVASITTIIALVEMWRRY